MFEVYVTTPAILQNKALNNMGTPTNTDEIMGDLRYRIEQVRVPGVQLMMADIPKFGVGPTQKMPFSATFQETTFSVLVDQSADNWQLWHNWVRAVFEFGGSEAGSSINGNKLPTYTVEYKDVYSTTVQIVIYDQFGNTVQRINLYEAYPTSIREIPLNWGDQQGLMRLAVSMAYTEYTLVGSSLEPIGSASNQGRVVSTSDTRKFTP